MFFTFFIFPTLIYPSLKDATTLYWKGTYKNDAIGLKTKTQKRAYRYVGTITGQVSIFIYLYEKIEEKKYGMLKN